MRKTKIVCTIGPASDSSEMLRNMMIAGMNVARLNFSHGEHESHQVKIDKIKEIREELNLPVAILLDTKGPEIRIGKFENGRINLTEGDEFILSTDDILGDEKRVGVTYKGLPKCLKENDKILLDDGALELKVKSIAFNEIVCIVMNNAQLSNNKSINLPGIAVDLPYLSEKDKSDIAFGIKNDVDFIALSFVRCAQDVLDVKHFLSSFGDFEKVELIAKIENDQGVRNIDEIIKHADGIMVARGDMGVEIPFEELPHIQKTLITKCYRAGKKVITATQMLESMVNNIRPTRAEITDVANAIYDGTSAIMLSGETASGKHPLLALKTMAKIAETTEASIDYVNLYKSLPDIDISVINAISHATCTTAHDLNASLIVTVTKSGSTARMISRFRPQTDIVAVTPSEKTYRILALSWGVTPIKNEYLPTSELLFADAIYKIQQNNFVKSGDLIVMTGTSQETGGITNTLQIHIIGNVLLTGTGNSLGTISSRTCVMQNYDQLVSDFNNGDIIVINRTTTDVLKMLKHCSGVITEETANESGVVAACLALDLPVISSAVDATKILKNGSIITMDSIRGVVHNGNVTNIR